MSNVYTELYYHFVCATKYREPLITPEMEPHLYRYIRHKCTELGVYVHALDGIADHTHLAGTLPPTLSVSDFAETVKGASSHFINHLDGADLTLYWQRGYGALTFSKRDLPYIVAYINNQKQHHADGTTKAILERCTSDG